MNNCLIYDIYSTGHHSEFIEHVIKFIISGDKPKAKYIFLLGADFPEKFPHIVELGKGFDDRLEFSFFTKSECDWAVSGSLFFQSFRQYQLIKKYALKFQASRVMLMHMNALQVALGFRRSAFVIDGILFSQFTRQEGTGLKNKLRYFRRHVQTRLFTLNKAVRSVYLLNDHRSCAYLNKQFNTSVFKYLPDPFPEMSIDEIIDVRRKFEIGIDRQIFLHFGSLSERKGTYDVLLSLFDLSADKQSNVTIILAGRPIDDVTDKKIKFLIAQLKEQNNKVQIIYLDGFITNNLKNNLFGQCDAVLIPYKNIEASSGIFGHAVKSGKALIGPNRGLLGEMIKSYSLGILLEETTIECISDSIQNFRPVKVTSDNTEMTENFTPEKFAKILLHEVEQ